MSRKTPLRRPVGGLVSAAEAAHLLGVKPATLYAYVSRGRLRSYATPGSPRRSYMRAEVLRLREHTEAQRDPARAAAQALNWGEPVLPSELTLIDGGRCYYRGRESTLIVRELSFERVTAWLWRGDADAAAALFPRSIEPLPRAWGETLAAFAGAHPGESLLVLLRLLAISDPAAAETSPAGVERTGVRILHAMTAFLGAIERPAGGGVAALLAHAWARGTPGADRVIDRTLALCADHELNVSTFTGRCVASALATPYDVLTAGLCALRGRRHGGDTDRTEALLRELGAFGRRGPLPSPAEIARAVRRLLEAGDRVPGFGHPLYPQGDPRWSSIREVLTLVCPASRPLAAACRVADEVERTIGRAPTVDLGLATAAAVLALPPGRAFSRFALGRSAGWLAHALEEYRRGRLIRPRAAYIGPLPVASVAGG